MKRKILTVAGISILVASVVLAMACVQQASPTPAPTTVPSPTPTATATATASPTPAPTPTATPAPAMFTVTSTAFKDGETMPARYTEDGGDQSPPLAWSGAPAGTKSFALICDDPDAPGGTFTHWVIFNIPGDASGLPEGQPKQGGLAIGALQGTNDFGNVGYNGPAPPPGGPHHYRFHVYALDCKFYNLQSTVSGGELLANMQGHVLADDELVGLYGR